MNKLHSVLERLLNSGDRVRLWLGDTETGKVWNEEYFILGTIGKSTGVKPCYLLIANKRSFGGCAISHDSILGIQYTKGGSWAYKSDNIQIPEYEIKNGYKLGLFDVYLNGDRHACNFPTREQANNYGLFMTGKRFRK